jgi:protein O-mannosyl-transferase
MKIRNYQITITSVMAKNKKFPNKPTENQAPVIQAPISPLVSDELFNKIEKWAPAILAALIFISYIPVWQNGFIWDDKPYIILNDNVKDFSFSKIGEFFYGPNSLQVGNYHPFTMLSLAIEYLLVKDSSWLYHFNNLVLHSLNSWLVFRLLKKLNQTTLISFITAVLFAVHPLHVESVAWAAERKDVLYTFFQLLALIYYIKYDGSKNTKFYIYSILLFVASCLSKGMGVVLPALLIITDYCFLKKPIGIKMFINKIPFFILTLAFAYIATSAQKVAGADASTVIGDAYNKVERFLIVCYSFCFYWIKTLIPYNLLPFHPYPQKTNNGTISSTFTMAFIGILFIIALIYWYGRKDKRIWWAGGFFTIAISTVLQILPVGSAIVADRYYYLSSIGPLFLVAIAANKFYQKSKAALPVFAAITVALCVMSFLQTGRWKNGLTLFTPADKTYPNDAMILSNLGWHHLENKEFPKAKEYLIRADDLGFKNGDVCRTIGSMNIDEGDQNAAIKYLKRAYLYKPVSNNTDRLMALAYGRLALWDSAGIYWDKYMVSLQSKETLSVEDMSNLGNVYTNVGKFKEAKEILQKAIKLNPQYWDAHLNYSFVFRKEGNLQEELRLLRELYKKAPEHQPTIRNLGVTLKDLGQWQETVQIWSKGAPLQSDGSFEYNIGLIYANNGDIENTKSWYIKSARKGYKIAQDILAKNGVVY